MVDIFSLPFDGALTIVSHTDEPHPNSLLRQSCDRPRLSTAAQQRDELAALHHSIT
jgi:hypothetical protein